LPPGKPARFGAWRRQPESARKALSGILCVLESGIEWEDLPADIDCGSGTSCRRQLLDWVRSGIWPRLRDVLLDQLPRADRIDWRRADLELDRVALDRTAEDRVWVWGVPLAAWTLSETVAAISGLINAGRPAFFITANTHYAMLTERYPDLRAIN
jgi:transposase